VARHVSDHRGSIIRELCTELGQNYKNGSIVSVDMDVVGVMAAQCEYAHANGHDRTIFIILTKRCTKLPDDETSVIRNVSDHF
jgi:hypothetical protein